MAKIRRAVLSCYDKTGLVELAQLLDELQVEMISTSGTLEVLQKAGIKATSIADFTGMGELFDGRVKSLHSKVHAGLLGIRDNKLHEEQMQAHELEWIDLVVLNLRPMESLTSRKNVTMDEVMEQVDVGGTAMLRSGAKNFRYVTVVVNPERYSTIMHELRAHEGEVSYPTRYRLAQEAFASVARYDAVVADYLHHTEPPKV